MALTWEWLAGEGVSGTAITDSSDEGLSSANNLWARETTIINPALTGGPAAVESYKAAHSGANESHVLDPLASSGIAPATARQKGMVCFRQVTDSTPPGAITQFQIVYSVTGAATETPPDLFQLGTDGTMTLYAGATGRGTAANFYTADATWIGVMIAVDCVASTSVRVRLWRWDGHMWGNPLIDYTDSLISPGDYTIDRIRVTSDTGKGVTGTPDYVDDIATFTYSSDADLPVAPIYVTRLQPDGNGANSDFSATGTGSNPDYTDVDDRPSDDATTTDGTGTGAVIKRQTYTLAATPTLPSGASIQAVSAISRWNCPNVALINPKILVRDNGTNTAAPSNGQKTGTYKSHQWCMSTAPSDSSAWTAGRIDGVETGAQRAAAAGDMLLTQTFALIAYTVHPSLPAPSRVNRVIGR